MMKLVLGILIMFLTIPSAEATQIETFIDNETEYDKNAIQYILAENEFVEAFCNEGDQLIKGSCQGSNVLKNPKGRQYRIRLHSEAKNFEQREGWNCHAAAIRPKQTLKVVTSISCRRTVPITIGQK